MSEDLNLPASLERLEINPESKIESCKMDLNRNLVATLNPEPECTLQSLSLKAECPKGNCYCNRKREKEVAVKRVAFKRPIVRRSKLNPLVLRSPVLRLRESSGGASPSNSVPVKPTLSQSTSASLVTPVSLPLTDDPSQSSPHSSSRLIEDDSLSDGTERLNVCSAPALQFASSASTSSCAVQARSSPDDTTIDELASYFDLFVHIPKKMSFMAEMMYT